MNALVGGRAGPYRSRRPLRAIVILIMLAIATTIVWVTVFRDASNIDQQVICPLPGSSDYRTPLRFTALDAVQPAPPNAIRIRVLNASTQVGIGGTVAAELTQWGFTLVTQPTDDPRYPHGDMRCVGQIRFGPDGVAAARTVSLLLPCAELVRDNRQDDTVDVALGTDFTDLTPNGSARDILNQLADWARQQPIPGGGLQEHGDVGTSISPALLSAARATTC